ncbi:MAG: hypothetical protein PHV82_13435 [Victivallaceae bacterium]|nr:hypothetical protein [Victivallaceae bacterium]
MSGTGDSAGAGTIPGKIAAARDKFESCRRKFECRQAAMRSEFAAIHEMLKKIDWINREN